MEYSVANEKAVKYLAVSMRTEYEVKQKLIKLGCEPEIYQEVLNHLKDLGYIDDDKYVQAFFRQNIKMPKYSIYELVNKLKQKGINGKLIDEFKKQIADIDYEEKLVNKIIEKKKLKNADDRENYVSCSCFEPDFISGTQA